MTMVKRGATAAPELRREIVAVDALKGDVAVTELSLTDRLEFEVAVRDSKSAKRSLARALMPQLLALSVLDADDEPVFSEKEWQAFGARHRDVTIQLFNTAFRLSGFDGGDNAKNS
jgi:hypothetical protein